MARHRDAFIRFDVPRDWDNRSVVAYAAPRRPGQSAAPNVVVTRDALEPDEDLDDYADRQLAALAARLRELSLVERGGAQVDHRQAVAVSFTTEGPGAGLHQRMLMVGLPDRQVATVTMTAPVRELPQLGPLFDRMVGSVVFAADGGDR